MRHLLRVLERAGVGEVGGNSGGAEGEAADRRRATKPPVSRTPVR